MVLGVQAISLTAGAIEVVSSNISKLYLWLYLCRVVTHKGYFPDSK